MSDKIILYGKPTCGMVAPVRLVLEQANADYEYINILADAQAKARVREINNGYESVPTLEFPDGSTLSEPLAGEVKTKLRALGYEIASPSGTQRLQALIANPLAIYAALLSLVIGVFSGNNLLLVIGLTVFGLRLLTNVLWARGGATNEAEP